MSTPSISMVQLGGHSDLPLLVCGPSLGTSATSLWSGVAARLADSLHVVAWDLPGHGRSPAPAGGFDMAALAAGVFDRTERILEERGEPGATFAYAGDSVGGTVGLQLLLDHPARVHSATLLCTSAKIGETQGWLDRAELVRTSGTPALVESSAKRWFAPGFIDREPSVGADLLHSLQSTDANGYARVCEALAEFDVRDRLAEIDAPVLAVAGADDVATPPAGLHEIADRVRHGRAVVLDRVAHLAPAEAPAEIARLIRDHVGTEHSPTRADVRDGGMAVRRAVLGDAHVDRAVAATTEFTRDFQDFITEYAWGSIWTRPGLDRRFRSAITLTALVAGGHHDELAMHVRAARTNGLSDDEIGEILLQSAIYCGVPAANTAFRIAQATLAESD
ncbi:MAG TPA: 4-carboxymuconolactone decarboxylase [Nocardioidaceae bacterium]|nr:4-carboxymuconolactone decarboxylase [Nocardioidaceae bacterium]